MLKLQRKFMRLEKRRYSERGTKVNSRKGFGISDVAGTVQPLSKLQMAALKFSWRMMARLKPKLKSLLGADAVLEMKSQWNSHLRRLSKMQRNQLGALMLMMSEMGGLSFGGRKYKDPLEGVNIVEENALIEAKKSKLSAAERRAVQYRYQRMQNDDRS
jgi:hypothetical protein